MKAKWENQRKEEEERNKPLDSVMDLFHKSLNFIFLFQVCSALRENLEEQHEKRLLAANTKFKPVVITDEPSRKASMITNTEGYKGMNGLKAPFLVKHVFQISGLRLSFASILHILFIDFPPCIPSLLPFSCLFLYQLPLFLLVPLESPPCL